MALLHHLLLLIGLIAITNAQERRLEPSHSFKAPFFLVRGAYLPHWEFSGSTVVTEEYVRLTPAIKSRTGSLWNTDPLQHWSWELELEFRIGGGGKIGADGMALWYTKDLKQEGGVFGMKDKWQGLGIIFDTFDNDGQRDNPQVTAVYNDGSKEWKEDGKAIAFGGCHAQFRNPYKNIKAKVRNVDGFVEVLMDTSGNGIWEPCVPPTRISIPTGYHFGLTAATGGLFDNHDIYALETFSLDGSQQQQQLQQQGQQGQQGSQNEWRERQALDQPPQPPANTPTQPSGQQLASSQPQLQQGQQPPVDLQPASQQQPFEDILRKMDNYQDSQPPSNQGAIVPPPAPSPPSPPSPSSHSPSLSLPDQAALQSSSFSSEDAKDMLAQLSSVNTKLTSLHQYVSKTPDSSLSLSDVKQELGRIKEQQTLIVEAFSEMLKNVVTKGDLDAAKVHIVNSVSSLGKDQGDSRAVLNDLKAVVNSKIGGRNDDLLRSIDDLSLQVKNLKQSVEQTQQNTRQIAGSLQQNAQDITQTIEKHTTFGFWSYFMFVQAIFIFGYVWWRKHKEDANKKLI